MARRAMLLPSSERYSTVTSAPAASLPWILVLPPTRNWTAFTPWSFLTVRRILDLPGAICLDNDCLSGVGCKLIAAEWAGSGVHQAPMVKLTRTRVARQSEVRNRIEFPPFRFLTGALQGGKK